MRTVAGKPLASLSSGLLARPGHAKPAMRPQAFAGYSPSDDLGWNDMGAPAPLEPAAPVPAVLIERAKLVRQVVPPVAVPPVAVPPAPAEPVAMPTASTHRAAFTVRLDPDRHLRLRLASAVAGRSSQHLLIAALDAFLDTQSTVEDLARQLPAGPTHRPSREFAR